MVKHGEEPFLECSSAGDKRFSAFFARVQAFDNRTIEEIYQHAKVFKDGVTGLSIREAKGKLPENIKAVSLLYKLLWKQYITENPELIPTLLQYKGLSDRFGQPEHVCQATELWKIRNSLILDKTFEEFM